MFGEDNLHSNAPMSSLDGSPVTSDLSNMNYVKVNIFYLVYSHLYHTKTLSLLCTALMLLTKYLFVHLIKITEKPFSTDF